MTPQTSVQKKAAVLAVTSGKGGVGKTNLAINVSVALARLGHRVAVVDADFGLGNIDVMLGLTPNAHVGHILSGEKSLRDVLMDGPRGLSVVPAGSGLQPLTALTAVQRERLTTAVEQARGSFDFLVIVISSQSSGPLSPAAVPCGSFLQTYGTAPLRALTCVIRC